MSRAFRMFSMIGVSSLLFACREAEPPTSASVVEAPSTANAKAPSSDRRVTPTEFHAGNKMDWIGVAHNRAMDEFRKELQTTKTRDACKVLERIAVDADIGLADSRGRSNDELRRLRKSGFDVFGCRPRAKRGHSGDGDASLASFTPYGSSLRAGQSVELSGAAWDLVNQVSAAADAANSSAELANALAPISASAQALGEEAAVVDAVASVALSSFEYWEQNGEAAALALASAYDPCLQTGGGEGCVFATSLVPRRAAGEAVLRLASNRMNGSPLCQFGFKSVFAADVAGAIAAIPVVLKFAGTPANAVVGIGASGIGVSAMAFVVETIRFYGCLWHI